LLTVTDNCYPLQGLNRVYRVISHVGAWIWLAHTAKSMAQWYRNHWDL